MDAKSLSAILSRRRFMQGAAMIGASPLVGKLPASGRMPPESSAGNSSEASAGKTGVQVSAIGVGGYHIGSANTDQAG